jgi:hypothetical protein
LEQRLAARDRGPDRRFEARPDAAALELELYAEADRLLTERYRLPAIVIDTATGGAATRAEELAPLIADRRPSPA